MAIKATEWTTEQFYKWSNRLWSAVQPRNHVDTYVEATHILFGRYEIWAAAILSTLFVWQLMVMLLSQSDDSKGDYIPKRIRTCYISGRIRRTISKAIASCTSSRLMEHITHSLQWMTIAKKVERWWRYPRKIKTPRNGRSKRSRRQRSSTRHRQLRSKGGFRRYRTAYGTRAEYADTKHDDTEEYSDARQYKARRYFDALQYRCSNEFMDVE